jgi:hypothetical protein
VLFTIAAWISVSNHCVGLGGQFTSNDVPSALDRYYGNGMPFSFQGFLRIRPSLMSEHAMTHEDMRPNEK